MGQLASLGARLPARHWRVEKMHAALARQPGYLAGQPRRCGGMIDDGRARRQCRQTFGDDTADITVVANAQRHDVGAGHRLGD